MILSGHKESASNLVQRLRRFGLTEAAELPDDGRERVVHHALQLAADALGEFPPAEVARLDVPLHQRHGDASHTTRTAETREEESHEKQAPSAISTLIEWESLC